MYVIENFCYANHQLMAIVRGVVPATDDNYYLFERLFQAYHVEFPSAAFDKFVNQFLCFQMVTRAVLVSEAVFN